MREMTTVKRICGHCKEEFDARLISEYGDYEDYCTKYSPTCQEISMQVDAWIDFESDRVEMKKAARFEMER